MYGWIGVRPELEQLARRRRDDVGRVAHQPAEVDALDADVPADELRRLQLGPEAARVADRHELAERAQSRDRGFEQLAADGIDHDVDPQVVGQLVVDVRLLGAELAAEVELLGGADGRDHRALSARATWIAAVPTPPAAACTSTVALVLEAHLPRKRDVGGEEREREAAPSANDAASGNGTSGPRQPPPARRSRRGRGSAITRVPSSSSPASSTPSTAGTPASADSGRAGSGRR